MTDTSIAARLRRFLARIRQGGTVRTTTFTVGEDGQLQRKVAHRPPQGGWYERWLNDPAEDVYNIDDAEDDNA